jgi:p-cumate 2,3-dioxygenase subunit beta
MHDALPDVAAFLYREADLLDRWQLHEWLGLFTEDARYVVPTTDLQQPDTERDLTLISDSLPRLRARVSQLLGDKAWAEHPMSRTRRFISNVIVGEPRDGRVQATANFMVHRFRHGRCDTFVGRYEHEFVLGGPGLRFRSRRAVLDHEALTPHAMVSFIL